MDEKLEHEDSRADVGAELPMERTAESLLEPHSIPIVITATFTADLLRTPLDFWLEQLDIPADIALAPYGQVLQELLNPQSGSSQNRHGFNILLIRLEDWIRDRLTTSSVRDNLDHLERVIQELESAIGVMRSTSSVSLFAFLFPSSTSLPEEYRVPLEALQNQLVARLRALARVHCWTHSDLARLYPLTAYEDPTADRLGHIPYTHTYFVALATFFARQIAAPVKPRHKVIAVDCDNTLWKGVCGEDGPAGVELTEAHMQLQRQLVQQHDAGALICLCSKNNSEDVAAVFRARTEMPLREEHIVASRINWSPKSANLQSLAEELDLSIDGFILIDDSELECAEVRAHCPSVLTLRFPEDLAEAAHFLAHVWAFDRLEVTEEARRRTAQYKENRARRRALAAAPDLAHFLASLDLKIEISPMTHQQLTRVAELIQRTTQFNLTGIRRRAEELGSLVSSGALESLVVHVRDRFGDYGLVGAVLLHPAADSIGVDTFVLSCRVLGRGVEYRIVNELGRIAHRRAESSILLRYRPTPRNAPAWQFLEKSFLQFKKSGRANGGSADETVFTVPAEYAESIGVQVSGECSAEDRPARPRGADASPIARHTWHEKALGLSRLPQIVAAIDQAARRARSAAAEHVPARTSVEIAIARVWSEVLGLERVGLRDDFFELGGDSLYAVRAISGIAAAVDRVLSIQDFFDAPTIETLAQKLATAPRSVAPIERANRGDRIPLSWSQQRLWFIDRLERGSRAYHIARVIRLRGELDVDALRAALDDLLARHEILRTVIVEVEGQPIQHIAPAQRFALAFEKARERDVPERARLEAEAAFDLRTGPLIRGALLDLTDSDHVLLLTLHHLVADGWSMGVLIRELVALYEGHRSRHAHPLPPLPIQYADYAIWERQHLTPAQLERELAHWKAHLQGAPELLELPTDRLRPTVSSYRGGSVRVALGSTLSAALKELSRRFDLTLAITLYAGWSVLISRLSGQKDIVLGMPVANRPRRELEGLIGCFINTLAVRVRLEDDPTLPELFSRARTSMLEAYANQDAPFEQVVETLHPRRSLNHSPIFQVMFVLHNTPRAHFEVPGLTLVDEEAPATSAQFDLTLALQESAEGLIGTINYASDLFDEATILRWRDLLETILSGFVHQPETTVSRLPLMSELERRRILGPLAGELSDYPRERLLHGLFEEQVARIPDATALVYEGQSLTYWELNGRANQLARYLRDKGVGPDRRVAICLERSLEMVVGILGILKAGGAYVPLDPEYPTERLGYMLEDSEPSALLTQQHLLGRLPPCSIDLVRLDVDWPQIARHSVADLQPSASGLRSGHLAYVIYTSGSTGQPKGVMIEHRHVVNLWYGLEQIYRRHGSCQRVALNASINFDASVQQWIRLLSGSTLFLVPQPARRDGSLMLSFLAQNRIEAIDCTPSQMNAWVAAGLLSEAVHRPPIVLIGGEAISPDLWTALAQCSDMQCYNVYGPTECTVDATSAKLEHATAPPHIGRPMPNRVVRILDSHGEPVPIGVHGEIYIGGAGIGRGYWKREELTAQRFLRDPWGNSEYERMYRTGDVGRWRADGRIEYVGRNDDQVKIRGFRIELGEIEAQLVRHPLVKEAVVVARGARGDERLVAYVTPREAAEQLRAEALRGHLKARLPEHMLPSAYVVLERMPLNPSGKLDRRALPAPTSAAYASREYMPPQGEIENVLARIWESLLKLDRVGRNDNFFELGGHSLMIVQMLERLRRVGIAAEIRRVFESPTLADLAATLRAAGEVQPQAPENRIPQQCRAIEPRMLTLIDLDREQIERIVQQVPGGAANVQDIYPLAPLQEGILFHHLLSERGGDAYVASSLLRVSSRQRLQELVAALQSVVDRHDVLRTAVLWEQLPRPVQVVYRHAQLSVQELPVDPSEDLERQMRRRMQPALQRMDLRHAPLIRLEVAENSQSGEWYALLQMHHIIGDNTSQEIVIGEVAAFLEGRGEQLPDSIAYRIHVWQALTYAREQDVEAFFKERLAQITEPTAPFGLLDVHGDGSLIAEAQRGIETDLALQIRARARQLGMSAATLFHAAWALVVARTIAREDVVFGSVLLGRMQSSAGAQRILGMFINTLPLRLQLSGQTARGLVEQTQRELIELLMHEQASLAVAQRCSGISGSAPLFTTLLNYRRGTKVLGSEVADIPGIELLEFADRTNYPITLSVDDVGEAFTLSVQTDQRIDPTRMLGYLYTALQSLVGALEEAPLTPALSLPVLPHTEFDRLVHRFNPCQSFPQEELIHQLFERRAELTPYALALSCDQEVLTYAELNCRANQVAHFLRARGIGPDELVGLCVERGLDMIVGLLGILKAGGAYLPLDPHYPTDRLHYMLQDAAPRVLLIQEQFRERFAATPTACIALDTDWSKIGQQPTSNPQAAPGGGPRQLAYVIYTSGSTGRPKGVMVEHRNVTRLFAATEHWFGFDERDVWTLFHSVAFDFSVWELWGALLYGGRLVIVPHFTARSPQDFYRLLCEEGVTVLNQTPSAFAQLIDAQASQPQRQHALRAVVFGGEALELRMLRPWIDRNGDRPQLVNMYGITETTVHVTYRLLTREDIYTERASIVGKPIPDLRMYLLNARREPVPVGVIGEIYVGGAGVARGYLEREELTKARFLPDPFAREPDARLYKTGDLGCWREDGTLEYHGRNDHQVKIRGFRIELGEIETQIARHPAVKDTVVLAREDRPGDKRLVAYVIPLEPALAGELGAERLRAHLKPVLPDYMVPGAFVVLDRFPLTSNGKLDRAALAPPDLAAFTDREHEAPHGEIEEVLAGIWQELLKVERVGRRDNFFELGGHSLLIVQMTERLRRIGLSIEIRRIFESASLAELAAALSHPAAEPVEVPPNLIPPDCDAITSQMLPLIDLQPNHIERIVASVPGGVANIQDIYPLTPSQEGILFHHVLAQQGGDAYVVPTLLALSSAQRLREFLNALQGAIDRYEVLRTAVLWKGLPRPAQIVYRQAHLPVEEVALDPARDALEQVREWIAPGCQRMFLGEAPLVRVRVAPDPHCERWYALLQIHHLTIDHVTLEIVISEVVAQLEGRAREPIESIPYRNHVAQTLAYERTAEAEQFFRTKLADVDEPTAPFGLLDVRGDGTQIEEAREALDSGSSQQIRLQARRLGVSAATLFHAAWALVVAHTSGRDDVVFGSVLLGRMQSSSSVGRRLGMFINTLPLRLSLDGMSTQELIQRTQRELVELLGHEHASLAVAQRCSGITGSSPLFTTLLNYRHSSPDPETLWSSAQGIDILACHERTNLPLVISVDDYSQEFVLTAQTDRRIDPHRIVAYLKTAMQSLIEALAHAPHGAALSLTILPASERRQVVESFNATKAPYPHRSAVPELFEEQVLRTPGAVAVFQRDQTLTYSDLNFAANRLARRFRAQGVTPGDRVPLLMPRSVELLIAQLAVLKAGGAYVPIDPDVPHERQEFIIRDCNARCVLVGRDLKAPPPVEGVQRVDYELIRALAQEESGEDLRLRVEPDSPACVMYTSGSTGIPKGVPVPHRGISRLVMNNRLIDIEPSDCFAHHSNPAFDASALEIWAPLLNGARVWVASSSDALDVHRFIELLRGNGVTALYMSVGLFNQYAAQMSDAFGDLRCLMVGGDSLEPGAIRRVLRSAPPRRLLNVYGPTECTTIATSHEIRSVAPDATSIPIGRPISNTKIYILDRRGEPVPLGVPGEIHIGGPGVACGYLNRPELTAQRFVRDPFDASYTARLYRTGDIARWSGDGVIEFLGRNDQQVKIRGFRVEPGEIEARLVQHPAVHEAVVVAREDSLGRKYLVAYVVCESRAESSILEELRTHLRAVLPEYMVPRALVKLERVPLTATGKVDKRALPEPNHDGEIADEYEAPQGDMECALAELWGSLLQVGTVGRNSNFFDSGGHSLLCMQLIARVQDAFAVEVPIAMLFEHPTLREFAAVVEQRRHAHILDALSRRDADIAELLDMVTSLPESSVQDLLQGLETRS